MPGFQIYRTKKSSSGLDFERVRYGRCRSSRQYRMRIRQVIMGQGCAAALMTRERRAADQRG